MPKHSRLFVKPFIGGLNTETSSVEDAILNTADELNCTILPEGIRGRRLGFNIERDGKWIESNPSTVSSIFYWDNVGKKDLDYIVVQRGTVLYFFIKDSLHNTEPLTIDLLYYSLTSKQERLRYAVVAGDLIVVGSLMDPIKISWNFDTASFEVKRVNLKWRDLIGVDDGLKLGETPKELTPEHKYNLFNQGWDKFVYPDGKTDTRKPAIDAFYEKVGYYPSNSMLHYLDKTSTAEYDVLELLKHFYGNTPAPKGHYILDYFTRSRAAASGLEVDEAEVISSNHQLYFLNGTSFANDVCASNLTDAEMMYLGGGGNYPHEIFANPEAPTEKIYLQNISGLTAVTFQIRDFVQKDGKIWKDGVTTSEAARRDYEYLVGVPWYTGPVEVSLYGQNDGEEPVLLNSEEYRAIDEQGYVGSIFCQDTWNIHETYKFDRFYLQILLKGINPDKRVKVFPYWNLYLSYVTDKTGLPALDLVDSRIKDITTLGGRYFYLVNDTVLFSQVLKDNGEGFDACYQEADPTSEEISDVVPTDGGYIKFPSMGEGQAIESFNRGVIVFGKSNVFGIISPAEQVLTATSYDIVELSRAGLIGPDSVVSTSDRIFYWSPLGIFQIGLSAETGNTVVAQSISINTIQEYYNNIPQFSKQNCVGTFDYVNNRIYWYYPTDESDPYKLNRCLILDLTHGAFMAFEIGNKDVPYISYVTRTPNAYEVKPTIYTRAGEDRVVAGEMPVIAAEEESTFNRWTALKHVVVDSGGRFSFGDYNSREFKDFDTAGYESYMVSKPIMFAGFSAFGNVVQDTATNKQVPVLQTLFKRTEQGALKTKAKNANRITTYNLKEYRQYVSSWADYNDAIGYMSRFMFAQSAVINTGLFQGAEVKVDLSSFVGESFNCAVKIVTDTGKIFLLKRKYENFDKLLDTFIFDGDNEEYKVFNIEVTVVNKSESYKNKHLGISGTLGLIRTNASEDTFTGFENKTLKGSVKLVPQDMSFDYKGSTKIEPSFITSGKFTFSSDEEWTSKQIQAQADRMDFFYAPGHTQPVNYGVDFKDGDDAESFSQSIANTVNLRKTLNFTVTRTPGTVNYEVGVAVPVFKKETGLFTTHTNYIGASGANIRMRWGWSLNDRSNRWDMIQNGYRPQKDFLHDEYVESRIHVRGRGKAFQVEIRNDDNKDFRLAGMNLMVRS